MHLLLCLSTAHRLLLSHLDTKSKPDAGCCCISLACALDTHSTDLTCFTILSSLFWPRFSSLNLAYSLFVYCFARSFLFAGGGQWWGARETAHLSWSSIARLLVVVNWRQRCEKKARSQLSLSLSTYCITTILLLIFTPLILCVCCLYANDWRTNTHFCATSNARFCASCRPFIWVECPKLALNNWPILLKITH